jgi:hypothetical protein
VTEADTLKEMSFSQNIVDSSSLASQTHHSFQTTATISGHKKQKPDKESRLNTSLKKQHLTVLCFELVQWTLAAFWGVASCNGFHRELVQWTLAAFWGFSSCNGFLRESTVKVEYRFGWTYTFLVLSSGKNSFQHFVRLRVCLNTCNGFHSYATFWTLRYRLVPRESRRKMEF